MYSRFQLATKYLRYFFTASSKKGHGIHSPFVFDFIQQVLNDNRHFYAYTRLEQVRASLLDDTTVLTVTDFGAGAASGTVKKRMVKEIAARAAKPKKWGQLLFRTVNYYQPKYMLELGTSLGLSAAYLASGNLNGQLVTIEGAESVVAVAKKQFSALSLQNIKLVQGNFDSVLPQVIGEMKTVDLAFIDGNHRKAPTLAYFQQVLLKKNDHTILIFDDIHWSSEMEEAWEEIKKHPGVLLTIDLFFVGFVFFRTGFKSKQHFTIRF
jgi:predicted O-methyltransferase YrrM